MCRAAEDCKTSADALEVALDGMCALETPFYYRYNILSAVDRRGGGQGLVQFASMTNTQTRVCCASETVHACPHVRRDSRDSACMSARVPGLPRQCMHVRMCAGTPGIRDSVKILRGGALTPRGLGVAVMPPQLSIDPHSCTSCRRACFA